MPYSKKPRDVFVWENPVTDGHNGRPFLCTVQIGRRVFGTLFRDWAVGKLTRAEMLLIRDPQMNGASGRIGRAFLAGRPGETVKLRVFGGQYPEPLREDLREIFPDAI
jgi:hypothetical protein